MESNDVTRIRAERRRQARAKALRAAQVVTLAAAIGGLGACSQSHGRSDGDAGRADSGVIDAGRVDSGLADAGEPDGGAFDGGEGDAGAIDAGATDSGLADAGMCPPFDPGGECCAPTTKECCESEGSGAWNEAESCCFTCVVGPLVPPAMTA